VSVVHLQVLHVAAVSYQVPETVVREPPVKLGLYHKLAGTPRPVRRGDCPPHPRNTGERETVSDVRDVRENLSGDALIDVEGVGVSHGLSPVALGDYGLGEPVIGLSLAAGGHGSDAGEGRGNVFRVF
jgi:hypothetical protein